MEAVDRWLRPDHVELLFHVGGLPHYDEAVRGWTKIYVDEFPHRSSDDLLVITSKASQAYA